MDCRTALLTVLDQVDYTKGACSFTEMVGAVLPKEVIALARKAIADEIAQIYCVCSEPDIRNNGQVIMCVKCGHAPQPAKGE
jgi:hypothetical protein